jgi:membrane-associated PAP2 superfamily phosphatase
MTVDRRFWLNHAIWPLLLFFLTAAALATTRLDESIAQAWAFDAATGRFLGTGTGEWWAKALIHSLGGKLMRGLGALLLLLWAGTFLADTLQRWRRPAGFLILCIVLSTGTVGLLKQTTNVDCPRSLAAFGGSQPYVSLFAERPSGLPRARCFPGGHSSSGFALFALYFLCLARNRRLARIALALALTVGGLFAFGQESRGAHFLSHDIWSAAIVWFSCLGIYALGYRGKVWETERTPCTVGLVTDTRT